MDLGYDLLTNKKKFKNIKKNNDKIENENDLLYHIKNIIIENEHSDIGPFIKLSEVKLLDIIKTSIDEYKNFIFNNNKSLEDKLQDNKKNITKNINTNIDTTKKITINLSKNK